MGTPFVIETTLPTDGRPVKIALDPDLRAVAVCIDGDENDMIVATRGRVRSVAAARVLAAVVENARPS